MPAPTATDLIFSEQANHHFSKTLGELKRHTLSIHNRLRSILEDAAFVRHVATAYGRPLIANERCGSWYVEPGRKAGSAYFKSTDGHNQAWAFSTRRLNLHLLETIGEHDGCIIVDSTRRGKRMPDALSKTVPIWCCVLNRALFPDRAECHDLYTPVRTVSPSEHAQITTRLGGFVRDFLELDIDLNELRARINKPLRPVWVTPESSISNTARIFDEFHPVICCTASRRVTGGEVSEGGYIQGSGDDTENWAFGLTPDVFWANMDLIFSITENELSQLIPKLAASSSALVSVQVSSLTPISPTSSLYITTLTALASLTLNTRRLFISLVPGVSTSKSLSSGIRELNIPIEQSKLGSRQLRNLLPMIVDFVYERMEQDDPDDSGSELQIIVACGTGKDHSVGVGLALLCLFYSDDGRLHGIKTGSGGSIDKLFIRRRLTWITTAKSDANPSGATLQSVNSYLIKPG